METAQPGISPAAKGLRRRDSKGASPLLSDSPQGQPGKVGLAAISTKYKARKGVALPC